MNDFANSQKNQFIKDLKILTKSKHFSTAI